jgi:hypothetical protein
MTADTIREGLRCGRSGCHCRRGCIVHCPSHQDKSPSLSVTAKPDRVLVHCFSGCEQQAVIAALHERGLWTRSRSYVKASRPQPKRIPSGHARCPKCLALMWWPDAEIGAVWYWCEDCGNHVNPNDAWIEYYEFPPRPLELRK